MNVADLTQGLAKSLHRAIGQVYQWAPAGQPEMPCAIIEFPEVTSYHTDLGHEITQLDCQVRVLVGRGDSSEALRQLGKYVSTDTPESILRAIEDKWDEQPWYRARVASTDSPRDDGDGVAITFYVELHA